MAFRSLLRVIRKKRTAVGQNIEQESMRNRWMTAKIIYG